MVGRITAILLAFSLVGFAASADEPAGPDIPVPSQPTYTPPPVAPTAPPMPEVSAPPPPWVEVASTSIGAGIGIDFGAGTLLFEGERHDFSIKGLSLGELGFARMIGEGDVSNLENLSDFEGTYMAVGAGAAAGVGASAVTMRNQNGVVITLTSKLKGAQIALGPEGFSIALK